MFPSFLSGVYVILYPESKSAPTFSLSFSVLTAELIQGSLSGAPLTAKKDLHLDVEVAVMQGSHLEMKAYLDPRLTAHPSLETFGSSTLMYTYALQ